MNELIGKIIAERYRVDTFLGKGGMAEVYKVWDQNRSAYLAMKILHSDLAEDKIFIPKMCFLGSKVNIRIFGSMLRAFIPR